MIEASISPRIADACVQTKHAEEALTHLEAATK